MKYDLTKVPERHAVTPTGVIVPDSCVQLMACLEVRSPDGRLKHQEEVPARSILRWWGRFHHAIFASQSTYSITPTAGGTATMPWDTTTSINGTAVVPAKMYFGTGTTAPTATDYNIQTGHTSGTVTSVITETSSSTTVDVSCSVLALSSVSLAEIVLTTQFNNSSGTPTEFAVARDTFTPVSVVANDGVTGRYKFIFNV